MVDAALVWLKTTQQEDGGWGEALESYADKRFMGKGANSSASQTAWALMGFSHTSASHPLLRRTRWFGHKPKTRYPGRSRSAFLTRLFHGEGLPFHGR